MRPLLQWDVGCHCTSFVCMRFMSPFTSDLWIKSEQLGCVTVTTGLSRRQFNQLVSQSVSQYGICIGDALWNLQENHAITNTTTTIILAYVIYSSIDDAVKSAAVAVYMYDTTDVASADCQARRAAGSTHRPGNSTDAVFQRRQKHIFIASLFCDVEWLPKHRWEDKEGYQQFYVLLSCSFCESKWNPTIFYTTLQMLNDYEIFHCRNSKWISTHLTGEKVKSNLVLKIGARLHHTRSTKPAAIFWYQTVVPDSGACVMGIR